LTLMVPGFTAALTSGVALATASFACGTVRSEAPARPAILAELAGSPAPGAGLSGRPAGEVAVAVLLYALDEVVAAGAHRPDEVDAAYCYPSS
jgi:predicted short-subunit dehydrogenase-like oxidoreductase (DUF2520 family)